MSIKNVYAQIVSFDNLLQAEKDARAGKRYENEQLAFWGEPGRKYTFDIRKT